MVLYYVTYSIPHLNIPRMSQTSRELALNCFCVCIYIYVKNESLPGTKIDGGAKGQGLYGGLGLNVSHPESAGHLDELVCDLCWGEEMFWSSIRR